MPYTRFYWLVLVFFWPWLLIQAAVWLIEKTALLLAVLWMAGKEAVQFDRISKMFREESVVFKKIKCWLHATFFLGQNVEILLEKVMALADDLKAGIAQLDAETTLISGKIDAVEANIATIAAKVKPMMTDQEVADIKTALQVQQDKLAAEADRLTTLAVDPTVPVPPEPPPLVAARRK